MPWDDAEKFPVYGERQDYRRLLQALMSQLSYQSDDGVEF